LFYSLFHSLSTANALISGSASPDGRGLPRYTRWGFQVNLHPFSTAADLASKADQAPTTRLTVDRVSPEAWDQIADWDQAVAASARPSVFLTRDWVVAWWRSFGSGLEPLLLRVSDENGTTVGLAPFYLERAAKLIPGFIRRLGLLGDKQVGSEYLGLVAHAGHESAIARAVVGYLGAVGIRWDIAELHGLREQDAAADALERELGARAVSLTQDRHPCSEIILPDRYETYLASLGSKFRQNYRNRANKQQRSCDVRFCMTKSESDLPEHLRRLWDMHQERWTAAGHPGSFADPRMCAFYLDVSRRLLRAGRLRYWHLEVDGVIRACQFGFVYDGVLHSLQEAYDAGFKAPGLGGFGVVLRAHAIRCAIEEGLRSYDFLGGVSGFKTRWGTTTHWIRKTRLGSPGGRARLTWLAVVGTEHAADFARAALPATIKRAAKRILRIPAR
jgi:CelD/BcsL family acetyltransferase involved in cellulose biosynthesis